MHVDGFDSELHETRIQYKNLNMHIIIIIVEIYSTSRNKHTIACICMDHTNLEIRHQSQECIHSNENVVY